MKRILITGATGHLGGKLFYHLEQFTDYDVLGLDLRPSEHGAIHMADFAIDGPWIDHLSGVDVIVHLAGDREPGASWESAIRNNMDATLALYHHAAKSGVKRIVLASSNWLHGGRRFETDLLTGDLPPHPINAYGMSKLFCERTGAYFSKYHGLSVICMRIGWTQWTHDNQPGQHMAMGRWGQEMWLSDRDYLSGMLAAIVSKDIKFAVLNLMSDNPGMRWDIETTKQTIGYLPQDGHQAEVNFASRMRSATTQLITQILPKLVQKKFADW